MATFTIAETVTLRFEIEASTQEDAFARFRDTSIRDFNDVDCSPASSHGPAKLIEIDGDPVTPIPFEK